MGRALPEIAVIRVYDVGDSDVGCRILVDRLWPRGLSKQSLRLDAWPKELAPSTDLRKWFGHLPERWKEFQVRYRQELREHTAELDALLDRIAGRRAALLYGARDEQHNHALVLRKVLLARRAAAERRK